MLQDQCISVTDLRTKTKDCLDGLQEGEPKYIFINNHPVAVLMDIQVYESFFEQPDLIELPEDEVTDHVRKQAARARRSKKTDLVNLQ